MLKVTTNTIAVYNTSKVINDSNKVKNNLLIDDADAIAYLEETDKLIKSERTRAAREKIKQIAATGKAYLGRDAMKRLSKTTNVLFECAKTHGRPVNLLTLTIAKEHFKDGSSAFNNEGDKLLKRLLLPELIKYLKEVWNLKLYIYRAEAQGRGALHFHFLIDCYVGEQSIMLKWNEICNRYLEFTPLDSPSTRIDGVNNDVAMSSYLMKYLTKGNDEKRRNTGGRQWGCSEELKKCELFTIDDQASPDLHAVAIEHLEDLNQCYPDDCEKFYFTVNKEITKIKPRNRYDILCITYRFNANLWLKTAPKIILDAKKEFYYNCALKFYGIEKPYTYRNSSASRLAYTEREKLYNLRQNATSNIRGVTV